MPSRDQARVLLSSPEAAWCGAGYSIMVRFSPARWSILLTFANRKRLQTGATSDVMGTFSAYTKPVGS
jgi:hypothetical protein